VSSAILAAQQQAGGRHTSADGVAQRDARLARITCCEAARAALSRAMVSNHRLGVASTE